jgi:hypothetical protein|uniref:Uncharacterized protein n=1 Tax=Myoviridae sp. ctCuC1 TaxID=2825055 RepID=A0A8S5U005_9CAUD|nr:MAG TPA: hypothetical protein [Myoviridae sp. ctCuC1]
MDQTKNNMDRIRAFDAEEGEWRTINGAHVLIKNGRIASGAGGALNGQTFRGGSLKKMPAGSKGMESGAYGRKLKSQAKEVAEKNRAAIARANAKYDRNRNERLKMMGKLMAEVARSPADVPFDPIEMRYRNAYEELQRENMREARATEATTHALNQEIYDLEGKAARHESHRGEVASHAQRALERYRKSREAEKGGASAPQQSAPHATKLGRMQPGSTAVNAGKEAKRLDHNARVYHRTARRAREAYNAKMDKAGGEPNAIEQKKNAYKAKSDENVIRRDQVAASAKGRLSKLRQLAKSLKARNPNAFKG